MARRVMKLTLLRRPAILESLCQFLMEDRDQEKAAGEVVPATAFQNLESRNFVTTTNIEEVSTENEGKRKESSGDVQAPGSKRRRRR